MVAIYLFFILAIQQGKPILKHFENFDMIGIIIGYAQNCDPGPCIEIPGLVYNADLEECAWPDEVGCSLEGNKHIFNSSKLSYLYLLKNPN